MTFTARLGTAFSMPGHIELSIAAPGFPRCPGPHLRPDLACAGFAARPDLAPAAPGRPDLGCAGFRSRAPRCPDET